MTAPDRLSRLFGLLCIVLAWMVRVGEGVQELDPPTLDNGCISLSWDTVA